MPETTRRDLPKGSAVAAAGMNSDRRALGASDTNPITIENANPGSTDWQLTRVRTDTRRGVRESDIEG